jgi:hypothetical protein
MNFTTRPLYSRYTLYRRLGGSHSSFRRCGKENIIFFLKEIKPTFLGSPARRLATVMTEPT